MQTRRRRQADAAASPAQQQQQAPILRLPDALLRLVLGHLSLGFRLRTCSRVCSTWAKAAADAATAITQSRRKWEAADFEALAAWLRRHVASTALRELVLQDQEVWRPTFWRDPPQLPAFALPVQQLRGLRVLQLPRFVLPSGSLRQLSVLTALTELTLHDVSSASSRVVTRSQARAKKQAPVEHKTDVAILAATAADLAHALQHLPALSCLALGGASAPALLPALTADSSVLQQQLVSLEVWQEACITPELVAALPAGLTRLVLAAVGPDLRQYKDAGADITRKVKVSTQTMPRLGQLTRLQELKLHGLGVDCSAAGGLADLLKGVTQLTSFSVDGYEAVAGAHTHADGSDELDDFLTAIGHLASLRSLSIKGAFRCLDLPDDVWAEDEEPPPSSAPLCAGLLASTSLTRLCLSNVSLPQGCGPHMFGRPGLRLPHLAELFLRGFDDPDIGHGDLCFDEYLSSDLQSIVACCQGGCLRQLTLIGVVKDPAAAADYSVLSALTTLTSLSLGGSSAEGVHELVRLRELQLSYMRLQPSALVAVAQQLTKLTRLSIDDSRLVQQGGSMRFKLAACVGCGKPGCSCCEPVCEQLIAALEEEGAWPE